MLDLHKQSAAAKSAHEKTTIHRQIEATDKQIVASPPGPTCPAPYAGSPHFAERGSQEVSGLVASSQAPLRGTERGWGEGVERSANFSG